MISCPSSTRLWLLLCGQKVREFGPSFPYPILCIANLRSCPSRFQVLKRCPWHYVYSNRRVRAQWYWRMMTYRAFCSAAWLSTRAANNALARANSLRSLVKSSSISYGLNPAVSLYSQYWLFEKRKWTHALPSVKLRFAPWQHATQKRLLTWTCCIR